MNPQMIKLLGLSALTAGILAAASGARADDIKAPAFTAEPCCNLCPAAHDEKNYTTRYQQNFTTLVQAQGDWLFRTREDLRTEFNTTPAGYKRMKERRPVRTKDGWLTMLPYSGENWCTFFEAVGHKCGRAA